MAIFSRWRTKPVSTTSDVIEPAAPPQIVGINAAKWRESALKGLESANKRFNDLNAEINRVIEAHREQVNELTKLKDQEVDRLKAHVEATRQVMDATRAALGTFPTTAQPNALTGQPLPPELANTLPDQDHEEMAEAVAGALTELETGRGGALTPAVDDVTRGTAPGFQPPVPPGAVFPTTIPGTREELEKIMVLDTTGTVGPRKRKTK